MTVFGMRRRWDRITLRRLFLVTAAPVFDTHHPCRGALAAPTDPAGKLRENGGQVGAEDQGLLLTQLFQLQLDGAVRALPGLRWVRIR